MWLEKAEKWLSEDNATFILGKGAPYTMADAMMTIFLARLQLDSVFFENEVL